MLAIRRRRAFATICIQVNLNNTVVWYAKSFILYIIINVWYYAFVAEGLPPLPGRSGSRAAPLVPSFGRRVVLIWHNGQPIGYWGQRFSLFLGTIARRNDYFNIALSWPKQPYDNLEKTWLLIQVLIDQYFHMRTYSYIIALILLFQMFVFNTSGNPKAWDYICSKLQKMLGDFRNWLKTTNYAVFPTDWQRFGYLDRRVDPLQYAALMDHWEGETFKVIYLLTIFI